MQPMATAFSKDPFVTTHRLPCGYRLNSVFNRRVDEVFWVRTCADRQMASSFSSSDSKDTKPFLMSSPAQTITPYLFFGGRCEEAIQFYQSAVGAEVEMMMKFNESPQPMPPGMLPAGFEEKVMHATFRVGETRIMASDGCSEGSTFGGFSLALNVATITEADQAFAALAEGGKVTMPQTETFWSPRYGMLEDRFGIGWMVMVAQTTTAPNS